MEKIKIRWSDFGYYEPIRLRIKDWSNLKIMYGQYMLVDSEMEYKGRLIELCVPYEEFVKRLRFLSSRQQKAVISGQAVFEIMKSYRYDCHGMKLRVIEQ